MGLNFNRNFYEQVNGALTSVRDLTDAAMILSGLLMDPEMFAYSRAMMLSYNENTDSFHGRVLLGASTPETHKALLRVWNEHRLAVAQELLETHEAGALHGIYEKLYTEMMPQIRQEHGGKFESLYLNFSELSENHILRVTSTQANVHALTPNKEEVAGMEEWLEPGVPLIAGRVITRMGLEGIIIATRRHETSIPLTAEISLYQWLMNLCSSTLDNLQLIRQLRLTAERLEEVDRLKSAFLSIVSHELRTPLTGILGFLGLVTTGKAGELTPLQHQMLKRALGQATHMESMVDDLLKLTEMTAGSMSVMRGDIHPVFPQDVVREVLTYLQESKGDGFTEPEVIPEDISKLPRIWVDPNALKRILKHLLENAYKFSNPSVPNRVTLSFDQNNDKLEISVKDRGIGMTQEQCKKIFDSFYQADFSLERNFGGLGIGLSVVQLLLRANSGEITVTSEPGQGSCFTVTFPLVCDEFEKNT